MRRRRWALVLSLGGAALLAGCGGSREAEQIAERFGVPAAKIQGCHDELSVRVGTGSVPVGHWHAWESSTGRRR